MPINVTTPEEQNDPRPNGRRRIKSSFFFQGRREVVIVHHEEEYVLRITRNGKLILTK
ncbi:MAG TPA: hemin uptake protein HemP [Candidatus Binatia bacterium]|nr:hemin uptake protein HemP [Candidatus Binatia bacterium]